MKAILLFEVNLQFRVVDWKQTARLEKRLNERLIVGR
jgi:hypothetical protein